MAGNGMMAALALPASLLALALPVGMADEALKPIGRWAPANPWLRALARPASR